MSVVSTDRDVALLELEGRPVVARGAAVEDAWRLARIAGDVCTLVAAALMSGAVADRAGAPPLPLDATAAFVAIALVVGASRGAYARRLRIDLLDDLRTVFVSVSVAAMVVVAVRELGGGAALGSSDVVRAWLFALVYAGAGRTALDLAHSAARARGAARWPTLIVGAGRVGRVVARRLQTRPELGLEPIGFVDRDPLVTDDDDPLPVPVLGASWDLERLIEEHGIRQVVVTFSTAPHEVLLRLVRRCETLGVEVAFVPRLFERMTSRVRVEHLGGLPLLSVGAADPKGWQFAVKHVVDRVVAAIAIVLLAPVFVSAAIAVRWSLGRPILFRQIRVGRDEKPFEMLKFRTLRAAPDGAFDAFATLERRTAVGEFLRRTSLDELPQLVNVLKGEMSLIGPRPERPELVDQFVNRIYRYSDRHRVKAGITGWAQIHGFGRGDDRFGDRSLAERVEWDNSYIENWSLWFDLKIALLTGLAVLRFGQRV